MTGLRVVIGFLDEKLSRQIGDLLRILGCNIIGTANDELSATRLITSTEPQFVILEGSRQFLELAKTIDEHMISPLLLILNHKSWLEIGPDIQNWDFPFVELPINENRLKFALSLGIEKFEKHHNWAKQVEMIRSVNTTRNAVERAKGIVMSQLGLSELQALHKLQIESDKRGISLKEIADKVIRDKAI